jgi:hypothetical protein
LSVKHALFFLLRERERQPFGRRSALTAENCPHIRLGNKALVKSMKFKCQRHGCGSSDVRLFNAHRMDEAQMFMAGDPLPDGREVA